MSSPLTHRLATADDIPALTALMNRAIADLLPAFLTPEQVAASHEIMGMDTQLIADRTYFLIEIDGQIAGCGSWSRRATPFGGDHTGGRDAAFVDPATEPARVRAMYTNPDFTRRGVGRRILELCEDAARAHGFKTVQMAATMGGEPLYVACGYHRLESFEAETSNGVRVPLVRMGKPI